MKTDLAPKYLYYYQLFVSLLCLIFISGVTKEVSEAFFTDESLMVPWVVTTVFWLLCVLVGLLVINKFVYITINPNDERKFVMGNILSNSHVRDEDLKIVKKVWFNTYKVVVAGRTYYILSFDKVIKQYLQGFTNPSRRS